MYSTSEPNENKRKKNEVRRIAEREEEEKAKDKKRENPRKKGIGLTTSNEREKKQLWLLFVFYVSVLSINENRLLSVHETTARTSHGYVPKSAPELVLFKKKRKNLLKNDENVEK